MTKRVWAGLDVGVETTAVCLIDDEGCVVRNTTCATSVQAVHGELRHLRRRRYARVYLEAGVGTTLARGLRNLGYQVDIYETRQLSRFLRLRRNKTDASDAYGIADAGRLGAASISKVHLKTLQSQLIQTQLTIRRHIIRQRVAVVNLLGRELEEYGGRLKRQNLSQLRCNVEIEIKKAFGRSSSEVITELLNLVSLCEDLLRRERVITSRLHRIAGDVETCRRFMQIPGVGPLCALTFYIVVGDPHRFVRAANIGSYLGLTPRIIQSGLTIRHGRISKMGNTSARTLLVSSSLAFMKYADERSNLYVWTRRVESRRGRQKARIALARKLSTVMLAMWKCGSSYRAIGHT